MSKQLTKLGLSDAGLKRIAQTDWVNSEEAKSLSTWADEVWDMMDLCREALGDEELVLALLKAMGTTDARENLEYIIQMYDLHSDPEEY